MRGRCPRAWLPPWPQDQYFLIHEICMRVCVCLCAWACAWKVDLCLVILSFLLSPRTACVQGEKKEKMKEEAAAEMKEEEAAEVMDAGAMG